MLLLGFGEEFGGDLFGCFDSFVGEIDGFGFADWIGDEALFVEAVADVPIEGFPASGVFIGAFLPGVDEEEGEGGLVDFFVVVFDGERMAEILIGGKDLAVIWQ